MAQPGWTLSDAPDLSGCRAVVTGANSGVGLATATHFAYLGADVVLACRNLDAAHTARDTILADVRPAGSVDIVQVDLSDPASVRRASDEFLERYRVIDILVNNAGVMKGTRELTSGGIEMDFATNFLGHFALTGQLLDLLRAGDSARIVSVCSKLSRSADSTPTISPWTRATVLPRRTRGPNWRRPFSRLLCSAGSHCSAKVPRPRCSRIRARPTVR